MIMRHKKNKKEFSKKPKIKLIEVKKTDCRFLFNQLRERNFHVNISHKKMPTYFQHVKFVLSKPYSKWYIIKRKNEKIGSIYLTKQNEIGIFLKRKFHHKGFGILALNTIIKNNPRPRYLANINPKNIRSINFFKKQGFDLIQHTYEMMPSLKKQT